MSQLPKIYIIQASDAPSHSATLQDILAQLKSEKRISSFQIIDAGNNLTSLDGLVDGDLVITMLTKELETYKIQIDDTLDTIKENHPNLKVAEIIVDKVAYENEYLTFPEDLRPIRDRDDMDAVWKRIEESLKKIFPVQEEDDEPFWSKYGKYVISLVVIVLLVWLLPKVFSGEGPEADFSYKVLDPISGRLLSDTSECYLPCLVTFTNQSTNFDRVNWDFGDTIIADKNDPDYLFLEPGKHKVTLKALKDNKENQIEKTINIKAPPVAGFKVINEGCEAPCRVGFQNTSKDSDTYTWEFDNDSVRSEEENPEKRYETSGKFQVKLTALNSDGVESDTTRVVEIMEDKSPFAQFEIKYNGPRGKPLQTVTFNNLSKNASQYLWTFGPDANPQSSTEASPTVKYNGYGTYPVGLKAIEGDQSTSTSKSVVISKYWLQYEINPAVEAQILANPQYKKHLETTRDGL